VVVGVACAVSELQEDSAGNAKVCYAGEHSVIPQLTDAKRDNQLAAQKS
jgi:hypothetical protein